MPSIIDRSPLMVAVSSGGTSPVLARLLREKLESILPLHLGQLARYAGHLRARVKQQFATVGERRRFWEKLFVNDRLAQSLANDDRQAVADTTEQLLTEPLEHRGEVVLVGAGPGDAGLLTLKGLQQIQQADVVVYDRLVSDDIMNLVRRDADRVFVGKRAQATTASRRRRSTRSCCAKRKRKTRGPAERRRSLYLWPRREELETLCEAGIPSPLCSALPPPPAAPLIRGSPDPPRFRAGRPLGHWPPENRRRAGLGELGGGEANPGVLHGSEPGAGDPREAYRSGMAEDMPAAIVENGTAVTQKVVSGTLGQLDILAQQMASPALIIVGRVVGLRDKLNWFSNH